MENEIAVIVKENDLEKTQAEIILGGLSNFLEQAKKWEKEAKSIVVTDVSQVDEMKKARELRLIGKNIRVEAEKRRKALKEDSLRVGKVIDSVGNLIKAVIEPIEAYLENQEKFAERIETERKERINAERIQKLSQYIEDTSIYNVKEMSEEAFEKLLETSKIAHEAVIEANKKAEKERLEKEKAEKEEQERIKKENIRLNKEAEEKKKQDEIKEKERIEEKKKADEKLKKEQDEKKKLEDELKARKDEEEKAKREKEAKELKEKNDKLEAERQAKLAPEKDKLFAYAESIKNISAPQELSKSALEIVKNAETKLLAISQEIKEALKAL